MTWSQTQLENLVANKMQLTAAIPATANATSTSRMSTLIPLSDYTVICIEGADANKFLQGQCTCDFSLLEQNQLLLGAHCTAKGRMIASFYAWKMGEQTIALRVHRSIAEGTLAALKKYAVFSKVTLILAENYFGLGIIADSDASNPLSPDLQKIATTLQVNHFLTHAQLSILKHRNGQYEIWGPLDAVTQIVNNASNTPLYTNNDLWHLANIERGIAEISAEHVEQFLPQELNFQLIGGISFKKGCYTGQEIVARLHYRGQLKKHLYRGSVHSDSALQIGASIYIDSNSATAQGQIVNLVKTGASRYAFLALCDDSLRAADTCIIEQNSSAIIQWEPLPYAIS